MTYDEEKRAKTLEERGLYFEDDAVILERQRATRVDHRANMPSRLSTQPASSRAQWHKVVVTWTRRDEVRVISMSYCHDQEAQEWEAAHNVG
jgi:uncharacterized DUF497 family protein